MSRNPLPLPEMLIDGDKEIGQFLPDILIEQIRSNCLDFNATIPSCARRPRTSRQSCLEKDNGLKTPWILPNTDEKLLAACYRYTDKYQIIVVMQKPSSILARFNEGWPAIIVSSAGYDGGRKWNVWSPHLDKEKNEIDRDRLYVVRPVEKSASLDRENQNDDIDNPRTETFPHARSKKRARVLDESDDDDGDYAESEKDRRFNGSDESSGEDIDYWPSRNDEMKRKRKQQTLTRIGGHSRRSSNQSTITVNRLLDVHQRQDTPLKHLAAVKQLPLVDNDKPSLDSRCQQPTRPLVRASSCRTTSTEFDYDGQRDVLPHRPTIRERQNEPPIAANKDKGQDYSYLRRSCSLMAETSHAGTAVTTTNLEYRDDLSAVQSGQLVSDKPRPSHLTAGANGGKRESRPFHDVAPSSLSASLSETLVTNVAAYTAVHKNGVHQSGGGGGGSEGGGSGNSCSRNCYTVNDSSNSRYQSNITAHFVFPRPAIDGRLVTTHRVCVSDIQTVTDLFDIAIASKIITYDVTMLVLLFGDEERPVLKKFPFWFDAVLHDVRELLRRATQEGGSDVGQPMKADLEIRVVKVPSRTE